MYKKCVRVCVSALSISDMDRVFSDQIEDYK